MSDAPTKISEHGKVANGCYPPWTPQRGVPTMEVPDVLVKHQGAAEKTRMLPSARLFFLPIGTVPAEQPFQAGDVVLVCGVEIPPLFGSDLAIVGDPILLPILHFG